MAAAALVMAACGGATRRSVPSIDALPSTNAPSLATPATPGAADPATAAASTSATTARPCLRATSSTGDARNSATARSHCRVSYCHTRETRVAGKSVWAAAGVVKRNAAVSAPGERTEHARRLRRPGALPERGRPVRANHGRDQLSELRFEPPLVERVVLAASRATTSRESARSPSRRSPVRPAVREPGRRSVVDSDRDAFGERDRF